jgi:paraquat-inducible protein B
LVIEQLCILMTGQPPDRKDHGMVVSHTGRKWSLAWLFPLFALAIAGWYFVGQWKERGPEIEIHFPEAPGMVAGKTQLIYRGVPCGRVTSVKLDPSLREAIVRVRLASFAADLAREGSLFWIDQPVISLQEMTGLEAIIQGNSIHARSGEGPPATVFKGRDEAPVMALEAPSLRLQLRADQPTPLDRGAPVYYRGAIVGRVVGQRVHDDDQVSIHVDIDAEHKDLIHSSTRFWLVPATRVTIGPGGISIDFSGIGTLIQGAVAFDSFAKEGEGELQVDSFPLFANEALARAQGPEIEVAFEDGRGLVAGRTRVDYLGYSVGLVTSVRPDFSGGKIVAGIQFHEPREAWTKEGTLFTLVRAKIGLEGIAGLETLLTGAYIALQPGPGSAGQTKFAGRNLLEEEWNLSLPKQGKRVLLLSDRVNEVRQDTPVLYRGLVAGRVESLEPAAGGGVRMSLWIEDAFASEVREESRFWRVAAAEVRAGPGLLKLEIAGLSALLDGAIAFDTFEEGSKEASGSFAFPLHASESLARADSVPVHISFSRARGILPGETQLRYLGMPVGLVEKVHIKEGEVKVTARLNRGFEFLRREGSVFLLVEPRVSLQGVSGLETLISGVFIECEPAASGALVEQFEGLLPEDPQVITAESEVGMHYYLQATATDIMPGAPVLYRNVQVGSVLEKSLSTDGSSVRLKIGILPKYSVLIREGTRFWDGSGIRMQLGFLRFQLKTTSPVTGGGAVGFATPEGHAMGSPAPEGRLFEMAPRPHGAWLRWNPAIPLGN